MDSTVASMLTTTPFFRPRDSCCPSPITSCRPFDMTSATTATTLEVPMSRPTIRFFASLVMFFRLFLFCFGCKSQTRRFQRQPGRVTHVHAFDPVLQPCHQLRIDPHQPLYPVFQGLPVLFPAQLHRDAIAQLHGPCIAAR